MKIPALFLFSALTLNPLVAMQATAAAPTATVDAAHLKSVTQLMAAMQAEKKLRNTVWTSRFRSEEVRKSTAEKFEKLPPARVYQELASRSLPLIGKETADAMTRFYESSYGKKVVYSMYNNSATLNPSGSPRPTAADQKLLRDPAIQKANQAMIEAEPALSKVRLNLLMDIANNRLR
jgi:hypothetical protein